MTTANQGPSIAGFILSQNYFQGQPARRRGSGSSESGIELEYWLSTDQGPLRLRITQQESVFFITESHLADAQRLLSDLGQWRFAPIGLKSFNHEPMVALYFRDISVQREALSCLQTEFIGTFEEDIRPPERFLMERFIQGSVRVFGEPIQRAGYIEIINGQLRPSDYLPSLSCLSLDIETSMRGQELYSIGLSFEPSSGGREDVVLMRGTGTHDGLTEYLPTERALLDAMQQYFQRWDPDLVIGWSVVNFDFNFLQRKADQLKVPLRIGRAGGRLHLRDHNNMTFAGLPGRAIIDGIDCLKGATYHFDSYSLENVARELLQRGKATDDVKNRGEAITRQFHEDKQALARYNIEDCRLVLDIFHHADLFHYLVARTRMTGLPIDKIGGSSQAFDNLYLPRLHRQGYVAPVYASGASGLDSPGGYVMDSTPGLYEHVLVLDFKSLYPSIILTFLIDPLGLVEGLQADEKERIAGFNQAHFHRRQHILPELLKKLWQQRDEAKAQGNKSLQQAIKIIMNSFYGVLGSPVCRFFDQRLSGSITLRGHQILKESRQFIEEKGYPVIYGDTDSVFVWASGATSDTEAERIGESLAKQLNQWWQHRVETEFGLVNQLEIEYETHFSKFLMPTIRGSDKGSKKRYAGTIIDREGEEQLVFKGLESVRSDWTTLAKQFQQGLYQRVFANEDIESYVQAIVKSLYSGEVDHLLTYHKRLRQPLEGYVKTQPPHVKAAKLAQYHRQQEGVPGLKRGDSIAYLITVNGPEPAEYTSSSVDYDHYLDKQLKPIAEGILPFIQVSFDNLVSQQAQLF